MPARKKATDAAQTEEQRQQVMAGWSGQIIDIIGKVKAAIDAISLSEKDSEGRDLNPPTDLIGQALAPARAYRGQWKSDMKRYAGGKLEDSIAEKAVNSIGAARRSLHTLSERMDEIMADVREAVTILANAEETYAASHAQEVDEAIAKMEQRQREAAQKLESLRASKARATRRSA